MANRLSKIVTRSGDDGTTGISKQQRLRKDSWRICAIGEVDELNTLIGLLCSEPLPEPLQNEMLVIQHDLFDLGGELSQSGLALITSVQIARLEKWLQKYNADLPPLTEFVLPGGIRVAALAHVCRAVCRRTERAVVRLMQIETVNEYAVPYLNRLSDLLFVIARELNRQAKMKEICWQSSAGKVKKMAPEAPLDIDTD